MAGTGLLSARRATDVPFARNKSATGFRIRVTKPPGVHLGNRMQDP